MRGAQDRDQLLDALLTVGLVWLALMTQPWIARWSGATLATVISFTCATALVVISTLPLPAPRNGATALALGLLAGATLRTALGLALPPGAASGGGDGGWRLLASQWVLAPVFEELLYRERLLVPLRRRLGAPGAVAITSGLFALPHFSPGLVAQAFLLGVGLGAARVWSGSVALCVGLHAGWNLAAG